MKNNILQCLSLDYRFNIIKFIDEKGEVSVNDIINEFAHHNIKQSVVSQTLKLFRDNGLVEYRGEKQKHIYFVKNEYVSKLIEICEKLIIKENNKDDITE